MIMGSILVLAAIVGLLVVLRQELQWARSRRSVTRDYEMSASADGTIAHLIPKDDGIAHEERWGTCPCAPTQGNYPMDDGRTGWLYIHNPERAGAAR